MNGNPPREKYSWSKLGASRQGKFDVLGNASDRDYEVEGRFIETREHQP